MTPEKVLDLAKHADSVATQFEMADSQTSWEREKVRVANDDVRVALNELNASAEKKMKLHYEYIRGEVRPIITLVEA